MESRHNIGPLYASPQNANMLGTVMTDPAVLKLIQAARADTDFADMRREYEVAATGTLGAVEGIPQNAFDTARSEPPEAPQA